MPVQYKDYYQSLGVPRTASDTEIKKAFRKLAREFHPDVAKNKKQAEEKFKEINEAYEVLGDSVKRTKYNELGANWRSGAEFRPPGGWENFAQERASGGRRSRGQEQEFHFGGTGFSDFFEQLFGSAGRREAAGAASHGSFPEEKSAPERGNDIEGDILVSLDEVMRGSVRSVSVRQGVPCDHCGGTGQRARHVCTACGGTGHAAKTETHQVKIPAGVTEGQRLRVAGRGESGAGGGAAGDLYLRVRLAKHPDFDVQDHNLIYEAAIAPWEAVLGANISVPTLNGQVNIKIPPGTQNGQKLRVRGRGLPHRGGEDGDLIVETRIEVPNRVTDSERKLWEQLARESHFTPRE
ncbi:MAG: J domain-containing protein [Verrucomicrobiota bacterium]